MPDAVITRSELRRNFTPQKNKTYGITNRGKVEFFIIPVESQEYENHYWENVYKSLVKKDGEYTSLNPFGEDITDDLLEGKLWK